MVQAARAVKGLKPLNPYCVTTHQCIATHLYTLLKTGLKLLKRGLNLGTLQRGWLKPTQTGFMNGTGAIAGYL